MAITEVKNPPVEEMSEDDSEFITLEFEGEDGETLSVECEIMGTFDVEGNEYIALAPDDDSDDVYIYGYKEVGDEDEFELIDIEDDEEWEKVNAEFERIMATDAADEIK